MVEHADDPAYAPPGADSFAGMRERTRAFRARMEPEQGTPLVVTHGIFRRFLLIDILLGDRFGPADAARLWQLRTVNCGLSAFDYGAPRRAVDHDTDHWLCAMWMQPLGVSGCTVRATVSGAFAGCRGSREVSQAPSWR